MESIDRRKLVLLLLSVGADGKIAKSEGGITRLQKLLFLLEKEQHLTPTTDGFEFAAYKAGPYSSKLYDDLEFLENLDYLRSEVTDELTEAEAAEVELLDFDELIADTPDVSSPRADNDGPAADDAYEERRFEITEKGRKKVKELIDSGKYAPIVDGIRKIKSKYGHYSLSDLLYYVYTKYPDMTTESEIKEKVLRRKR